MGGGRTLTPPCRRRVREVADAGGERETAQGGLGDHVPEEVVGQGMLLLWRELHGAGARARQHGTVWGRVGP